MNRRLAQTLLTLALSLGAAHAQNLPNDGTPANTQIKNTAEASYTHPGTSQTVTFSSNIVVTTILPKPGFDSVYSDGNDGLGSAAPAGNTVVTAPAFATGTVAAGGTYPTAYRVVNNGNTQQTISLTTDNGGALKPADVLYYVDTNKDGVLDASEQAAGPTTTITLPFDDPATTSVDEGIAYFIQVIKLPADATPGQQYAATPVGTGQGHYGAAARQRDRKRDHLGLAIRRCDGCQPAACSRRRDQPHPDQYGRPHPD